MMCSYGQYYTSKLVMCTQHKLIIIHNDYVLNIGTLGGGGPARRQVHDLASWRLEAWNIFLECHPREALQLVKYQGHNLPSVFSILSIGLPEV